MTNSDLRPSKGDAAHFFDFAYDGTAGASNGNLANDGVRLYEWDALNRLKVVKKKSSGATIAQYEYDALNRRIRRVVSNGGLSGTIPNGTTDFVHNGSRCCEERDGSNSPFKQYVWGIYIDELIQQKTFTTINGNAAGEYYPLSDLLYRTIALTNSSGTIVEAYDTDAYGNTLIFTSPGTGGNWFADDAITGANPTCEFIFTGRRLDAETESYFFRARYFGSALGRFVSRDQLGCTDSTTDVNLYQYAGGNPIDRTDPEGLRWVVDSFDIKCFCACVARTAFSPISGRQGQLCIRACVMCAQTPHPAFCVPCAGCAAIAGGYCITQCTEMHWEPDPVVACAPTGSARRLGSERPGNVTCVFKCTDGTTIYRYEVPLHPPIQVGQRCRAIGVINK